MDKRFIFTTDIHFSSTTPASRIDDYTEAVFKKFEWVLRYAKEEKCSAVLLGGDTFNTPTQVDSIKNRIKKLIRRYDVPVYGVAGNHDLIHYSMEELDRTSLQTLSGDDGIRLLEEYTNNTVTVDGVDIIAHYFKGDFPKVENPNSIILSHTFFNTSKGDRLYTSPEEVEECGAMFACFGHDHNMHKVKQYGGTDVVRPGALSRGSSHTENKVREISVALLNVTQGMVEYIPVPDVKPFEEIFMENYDVKRDIETVSFEEIAQFMDDFRQSNMEKSPYDLLHEMSGDLESVAQASTYLEKSGLRKEEVK